MFSPELDSVGHSQYSSRMTETADFIKILKSELQFRQMLNANYSLRAFARDLGTAPSSLSEIMNGHKRVTPERATRLLRRLNLTEDERQLVLKRLGAARTRSKRKVSDLKQDDAIQRLHVLKELVSHWSYFAILEAIHLKDFQADPRWVARRLKMPVGQVKEIVQSLLDLEILEITPDGRWIDRHEIASTTDGIPSQTILQMHLSLLEKCKATLIEKPVEERLARAMIFALPAAALPEVEKAIMDFQRKMISIASKNKGADDVQCVTLYRFALSEQEKT